MDKISDTTYKKVAKDNPKDFLEVVIGDALQPDFKPQAKIQRWDNEANVSIRLKETPEELLETPTITEKDGKIEYKKSKREAHFYDIASVVKQSDFVRYVKMGYLDPITFSVEYEMFRKLNQDIPTIDCFWADREMLLFFGYQQISKWYDESKLQIPVVRLSSSLTGNPMYADRNIAWLNFHYHYSQIPEEGIKLLSGSIVEILDEEYGIKATARDGVTPYGLKLFFEKDGKLIKFFSSTQTDDRIHCYINFGTDYNRSMDLYKTGAERDSLDVEAGGLWLIDDTLNSEEVLDKIVERFILKLGKTKIDDVHSVDEIQQIEELKPILGSDEWVRFGDRNDDNLKKEIVEGNGFEFDINIKEKPVSNRIEFSINSKGVAFWRQPELTREEKDNNGFQPINARGSYAIYTIEEKRNYTNGKDYKNNKVGHLFFPYIEDSNGWKVRAEDFNIMHNIETGIGELAVTIPQDFLDNAIYPIRNAAGLEFGYHTNGGSGFAPTGNSVQGAGITYSPASDGTLDSMSVYASGNNLHYKLAVYNGTALVDYTGVITLPASVAWTTGNVTSGAAIVTANNYYLIFANETGTYTSIKYDVVGTTDRTTGVGTYATFANPETWTPVDQHYKFSIYATYTPSGGGVTNHFLQLLGCGT